MENKDKPAYEILKKRSNGDTHFPPIDDEGVKQIIEAMEEYAALERDNALKARDEAVDELNKLIDVYGKVWAAFPPEVLSDQLNDDYDQCADTYFTYFEEED